MSQGTEVTLYDPSLFPKLRLQDPDEVQARFAQRFAKADSVEDLFNVLQGNSSKDMVGRTVEIRAVEWAPYESERGIIPNAICDAVDVHSGEALEFATTSFALTHFIARAEVIGGLPFVARIASKKTNSGQTALNFESV